MAPKRKLEARSPGKTSTKKRKDMHESKVDNGFIKCDEEKTGFSDLPAELRNQIYELALVSPYMIPLTRRSPKIPPLTIASRQLRRESFKIWSMQNTFHMRVIDCDASIYIRFMKMMHNMQGYQGRLNIVLELAGRKRWSNVLKWCKELHEHPHLQIILENEVEYSQSRVGKTIAGAHEIVLSHKRSSWKDCLRALTAVRQMMGSVDQAWLRD